MHQIPADAIARLAMISGNLTDVAEIAQILESYSYQQDNHNPNRWILADTNAALEFSQDGEVIDIYSDSDENILNLNYIAMRIGWAECNIYTISKEIEDNLLLRLVNISVTNQSPPNYNIKESLPLDILETKAYSAVTTTEDAAPPSTDNLQEDHHQIQEWRSKLAKAEQQSAQFSAENHQLQQRIQELENMPISSGCFPSVVESDSQPSADPALIRIVEKYLLSQLDLSTVNQSGLMKELKEHGYAVHVKLSRQQ